MSQIRVSRRGFVAGAAAALAAPMIIPRHVLGDDKNVPANEKIVLGCVGIGKMMYGDHLPHLREDARGQGRGRLRRRHDAARDGQEARGRRVQEHRLRGLRRLPANCSPAKDIDAVACATPDHWHAMVILDTCKAGKDMYCEKPLTNNLMEAKTVMDAVNASKIIFQTGSQQRSSREFRYACELVPQRPHRQDQAGARRRGRPAVALQPARRGDGAGPRLGTLARPGADARLQLGPQPARHARPLSRRGATSASTAAAG